MGGPAADAPLYGEAQHMQISGRPIRAPYDKHSDDDDFVQPGALYRNVLSETEREHLTSNIAAHARHGVNDEIQGRVIEYWRLVDADLGARVEKALSNGST
jgi:catalase